MDAENGSEKGKYPLSDEFKALSDDAKAKRDEYQFISRVDVPASKPEEKDYWVRREKETCKDACMAEGKRDRFAADNAKGLAREEEARREGKPLEEGERAEHESRVRGFEDLEAGRKTQEGFAAGQQRYDARMERDDQAIHDRERKLAQDVRVGDGKSAHWDSANLEAAKADYTRAGEERADFAQNYWKSDGGSDKAAEEKASAAGKDQANEAAQSKHIGAENSL